MVNPPQIMNTKSDPFNSMNAKANKTARSQMRRICMLRGIKKLGRAMRTNYCLRAVVGTYTTCPGTTFTLPGSAQSVVDVRKRGTTTPVVTANVPAYTAGSTPTGKTQLVFDGDSRTQGTDGQIPYSTLLQTTLGSTVYGGYNNIAVGGSGTGQLYNRIPTTLYPLRDSVAYPLGIYVYMIGINDWGAGGTGQDSWDLAKVIISLVVAHGFQVIVCTVPGVGQQYGTAFTPAQLEAQRVIYNNQMRAGWKAAGALGLVDLAADARFTPSNHDYYDNFDNLELHFTTKGNQVMADLIAPAIRAVAAGTTYGAVTPVPVVASVSPAAGNTRHYKAKQAVIDGSGFVTQLADSLSSGDVLTPIVNSAAPKKVTTAGVDYLQFNNSPLLGALNLGWGGGAPRTLWAIVQLDNMSPSELMGVKPAQPGGGALCEIDIHDGSVIGYPEQGFARCTVVPDLTKYCVIKLKYDPNYGYLVIYINNGGGAQCGPINTSDGPFKLGAGAGRLYGGGSYRFLECIIRNDNDADAENTNDTYCTWRLNHLAD